MRACYMQEAYTNTTSSKAAPGPAAPQLRIITGSSKELDNIQGKGAGQGHPPKQSNIGKGDIVLQPAPLENFGKGKGNMTKAKNIITEPVPSGAAPAPAAPAAPVAAVPDKATGPLLVKPIPAEKGLVQTASAKVTQ